MRHRTRALLEEASRPREFPPRPADLEVVAGGIGCTVIEITRPGMADSCGADDLNIVYTEFRNDMSFLNVLVTYICLPLE